MGRPGANSGSSQPGGQRQQQPQEYHFQPATQTPETIDDALPPFESSNDENQQEHEPPQKKVENSHQNHQSTGVAFPPQSSQLNASHPAQFPPENTQRRSPARGHDQPQAFPPTQDHEPQTFPPQSPAHQPQAFPLPQYEPQAFPQSEGQPQAFPPPQGKPQAFPPPQHEQQAFSPSKDQPQAFPPPHGGQPQAFPPPQGGQPQAFPPPHGAQPQAFPPPLGGQPQAFPPPQESQPQAFPPSHGQQPQAFPPPQEGNPQTFPPKVEVHSFPPPEGAFQHQNMPQYQQPTSFSTMGTSTAGLGQSPVHQAMPNPYLVNSNPQVINNTPMTGFPIAQPLPTEPWKTTLFECMDNPTNALITACFPCVTFGQIAEIIDSGQTSCSTSGILYGCIACFIGLPCLLSCSYRTKLRARYGLIETPASDWIIHCCCEPCALCQEYRELERRGIDPSIGWLGNLAKSRQMVQLGAMTPPAKQNMMG